MTNRNNKIDALQFFMIGTLMGNALFVGMGNIILVQIVKQNTWLVALASMIIGIIPILILNTIMNYSPNVNILEKIRKLFNPVIAYILNLLIAVIVCGILIISIWSISTFSSTKYLTETPLLFIGILFITPAIYACIKGIETIARTTQILFYFTIIMILTIILSLTKFIDFENVKPILAFGLTPIFEGIFKFITYCFTPFITLLIIPKNDIVGTKKLHRYLILGYVVSALFMAIVFFVNMSVLGIHITSIYRYPEYYVIKKISISSAFDNIENFLAAHWIFNIFIANIMSLYYLKEYVIDLFKIKKQKNKYIITATIGLVATYLATIIFKSTSTDNNFMNYKFPIYFGISLIIIISIIFSKIITKNKKRNKKIN